MSKENGAPAWHSLINGTEAQIDALKSDKYLTVVSAGAGTGKTQTLAQRFAWLLASDPECRAGEILVLTFTKKAAGEMRDRIKNTLVKWRSAFPKELAHLQSAIDSMDDAYISTIHSFAMKMIRESGLELDVDPAASIMPEAKAEIWWKEYERALSALDAEKIAAMLPEEWRARAAALLSSPDLTELLNAYGPRAIAEAAEGCAEKLYCAGQTPESLWRHDDAALLDDVASLKESCPEIFRLWKEAVFPAILSTSEFTAYGKKPSKTKEKFEAFVERWKGAAASVESAEEFLTELISGPLSNLNMSREIKGAIEAGLGCALSEWRDEKKNALLMMKAPSEGEKKVNGTLCEICALGWAAWDEFRRRESMLSLSDLIRRARDVLESSPAYKRRFKHIMIDEFQDTDPLQDELVEAMWTAPDAKSDFHNTLFIVGDQKQSIYRFRHADLTLFRKYIEKARVEGAEGRCKYVSLDRNFRTSSGLLERFNDVFENIWEGDPEIIYERLLPPDDEVFTDRRNEKAGGPYLRLLCALSGEEESDVKAADLRLRLYAALGREIMKAHAEKKQIWDKEAYNPDGGKGAFRAADWKDFAVLVPSRAEYDMLERAFDSLSLPYLLSTSKKYFARGETGDLVNFISLLSAPEEPLFLAGWLASPLSGLSSEEAGRLLQSAFEMRESGMPISLSRLLREKNPPLSERVDRLRRIAHFSGVSAAIRELMKRPFFLESYDGTRRRRVCANISHLADVAEEYEKSEGRSLKGCAEYLLSELSTQGAKEEPDVADESADAVRVMTVHASKGLEFPITALVYREGKRGAGVGPLYVSKRYGVTAKLSPRFASKEGEELYTTALWEESREAEEEKAERKRLWYVGFTRAADELILCGAYKKRKDGSFGGEDSIMLRLLESGREDATLLTCDVRERKNSAGLPARPAAEPMELAEEVPAKLGRISASAYALLSWCPAAYRTVYRQGRAANWLVKGGDGGGSEFGSLSHWLLARWDFDAASLAGWLPLQKDDPLFERVSRRLPAELRGEFADDAKRREARELLTEYSRSAECAKFAALAADGARPLMRETRFRVPDRGTLLVGSTDVFWQDQSGLHLRDWKTSAEKYSPSWYYERQLEFYAYALHKNQKKNSGAAPIDSAIIYLRSPERVREPRAYSEEDFSAIAEAIEAAAVTALSGSFAGAVERCGECPWRRECAARTSGNDD